jgi:hypothetical protein
VLGLFRRFERQILVTEFGTNAFEGAPQLEGDGWSIVDYAKVPRQIRGKRVRNEQVQADYLVDMLEILESQGIHGAYVYELISPGAWYSPNPRVDLDLASFSIVKAIPDPPLGTPRYRWEPKQAFHALAEHYGEADGG